MLIPVGILAALSTIAGFLVIPGVWEPFLHWIDGVAEPLVVATVAQDYSTSAIAVLLAGTGIWLARGTFPDGEDLVPPGRLRTILEHKLYFDELYDALFSRPSQLVANLLREKVEEPVIQGAMGEIGDGVREAGSSTARLQTGLLRSYALVIAVSVVILVIVFMAVR
jgi:NADH-quinone oxidoreductase subunit L